MTESMSDNQFSFIPDMIKQTSYSEQEKQFVLRNLDKTNRELAAELRRSEASVRTFLSKEQIRRSDQQLEQIRMRIGANQTGENNPNFRGNRSSDHYYYKKRMAQKYPEKMNARNKVYRAVKSGKLQKLPCEVCGNPKSEAHHFKGYDHPLEVQWLCREHHNQVENQKEAS